MKTGPLIYLLVVLKFLSFEKQRKRYNNMVTIFLNFIFCLWLFWSTHFGVIFYLFVVDLFILFGYLFIDSFDCVMPIFLFVREVVEMRVENLFCRYANKNTTISAIFANPNNVNTFWASPSFVCIIYYYCNMFVWFVKYELYWWRAGVWHFPKYWQNETDRN